MKKLSILILTLLLLQESNAQLARVVLYDINVVYVKNGKVNSHQVVIIKGDRITEVIPLSKYRRSAKDSVIEQAGKFVMPGLWDMHTHVWSAEYFFPLFLANGITGFRDMFGGIQPLREWRKSIAEGNTTIPDFYYSGPIVDGPKPIWPGSVAVANPEQGRRAVDSLKNKLKVDFVKVYSLLSRESYFGIAEECKRLKIDFAGHVPTVITALEAAEAGQKCQEHLYGILEVVSDSSELYFKIVQGIASGLKNIPGADSMLLDRMERRKLLLRTFNNERLLKVAKQLSATRSWICPTLVVNYNIGHLDDSTLANDERMKYIARFMKNFWDPRQDIRFRSQPKDYYQVTRMEFEKKLQMIPVLHKAGVKLLAGTDTPNPYCFPGFSLHDELAWFVKSELSPAEALQTATINPAIYFAIEKDYGTVEKGKIASLLILDQNPIIDISNTTSINSVILRGGIMNRNQLDGMLEKVKDLAQK